MTKPVFEIYMTCRKTCHMKLKFHQWNIDYMSVLNMSFMLTAHTCTQYKKKRKVFILYFFALSIIFSKSKLF